MAIESVPQLSELDLSQFKELVGRESVTWAGQDLKMRRIREMVTERLESMRRAGRNTPNDIRFHDVRLENGKTELIVGRGDHVTKSYPAKRKQHPLNVFVPAHIDTVTLQTPDLLQLQPDAANPDHVKGRGTYDMLGQALNSIALATTVHVPKGMNVFFGFIFDEERNSHGAQALMDSKNWEWWHRMDVVISGEIGHVEVPQEETRRPYIIGRKGRHKYHLALTVDEMSRGHFADARVRSAGQAIGEAKFLLKDLFNHGGIIDNTKPLIRSHPQFGSEKLEFGSDGSEDTGDRLIAELEVLLHQQGDIRSQVANLVQKRKSELELQEQRSTPTTKADFYYSIQSVPGRKIEESIKEQRQVFELIAKYCEWAKHGISWSLTANAHETSYDAFEMPERHALNFIVQDALRHVSTGGYPVRAPSVADENLYATSLLARPESRGVFRPYQGVISIPPIGNNAHRNDEWVSLRSLAEVREVKRRLIEDPNGLLKLRAVKRQSK